MTDSIFNAEQFLDTVVEGAMSTKIIPCPEGEWMGLVDDLKVRQWKSKDGLQMGVTLDVMWLVEDESAKTAVGRDKVVVKQGVPLDLTEAGRLDTSEGKNVRLGRLREALDLNTPGVPFAIPMMKGRMAKVEVYHRSNEAGDETYAEVKKASKLG